MHTSLEKLGIIASTITEGESLTRSGQMMFKKVSLYFLDAQLSACSAELWISVTRKMQIANFYTLVADIVSLINAT